MRSRGSVGRRLGLAAALLVAALVVAGCGGSPDVGRGSPTTALSPAVLATAVVLPTAAVLSTAAAAMPSKSPSVRPSSLGVRASPASSPSPRRHAATTRPIGIRLGPVQPPAGPQCTGPGWEHRRGTAMLAQIGYPYWGLSFTIRFHAARDGYLGYTSYSDRLIVIYVRPCSQESDVVLRHTIAHEIGHAVDYAFADDTRRARWKRLRGIAAVTPWYGCSACTDYDTPAGDFAEAFAYWQAGPGGFRSDMAGPPTAAQLRAVNALFWP